MPIKACWHTHLLPDSQLRTENQINFLGNDACKYALQKVYIPWSTETHGAQPGDLVFFYRMGEPYEKRPINLFYPLCVLLMR